MPTVSETIPAALQPDVDAALEWFNRDQEIPFEVTGILDPDAALSSVAPRELKLVLCGGDRCEQRSFRVASGATGREVGFLEDEAPIASEVERQAEEGGDQEEGEDRRDHQPADHQAPGPAAARRALCRRRGAAVR